MATKKTTSGGGRKSKKGRKTRAQFLDELLSTIEGKLQTSGKATVAEYIRLLELRREYTDEVKEIEIRWVDSLQTEGR